MKKAFPLVSTCLARVRPKIDRARTVLPEPLSPTMPRDCPRLRVKLTPRTACSSPIGRKKLVWRSSTRRISDPPIDSDGVEVSAGSCEMAIRAVPFQIAADRAAACFRTQSARLLNE